PEKPCRESLIHQAGGGALAIRKGDWKLIPNAGKKKVGPELFNLADDPIEAKNQAANKPDVVKELTAMLKKIQDNPVSREP
ncbi:MAG: arylsulfatase, partial [Planctomycetia bacterium]|nr:arylsulfatase [Planctomycetia bacterium]